MSLVKLKDNSTSTARGKLDRIIQLLATERPQEAQAFDTLILDVNYTAVDIADALNETLQELGRSDLAISDRAVAYRRTKLLKEGARSGAVTAYTTLNPYS